MSEQEHDDSRFPGMGVTEAECENGHTADVRDGDFPYVGHCSEGRAQVSWRRVEE